jgi:hypothetical protein
MRKPGLTQAEFTEAMGQVQAIYDCLNSVPNIVGPTYGAAMCDLAGKIWPALHSLAVGLEDQALEAGFRLDRAEPAPLKSPAQARHELDGSFPADSVIGRGRLWAPLTAKEHHALGLRLKDARNRLPDLLVRLANAFPQSSGLANRVRKVEKAVSSLRNQMDNRAHEDWPAYIDDQDGIGPARKWYYGEVQRAA